MLHAGDQQRNVLVPKGPRKMTEGSTDRLPFLDRLRNTVRCPGCSAVEKSPGGNRSRPLLQCSCGRGYVRPGVAHRACRRSCLQKSCCHAMSRQEMTLTAHCNRQHCMWTCLVPNYWLADRVLKPAALSPINDLTWPEVRLLSRVFSDRR